MSKVSLVLLMGLPGSGKSTLCQKLLSLDQQSVQIRHVCYDKLLEVNDSEKWRNSRDNIIRQVEEIILNYSVEKELIVLLDDNFYYQSMRRMYYKMAKRHAVPTCIVFMQCSEKLAIARVEERVSRGGLQVGRDVISQMAQRMELPVENNWEKYCIKLDSKDYDVDLIWKSLLSLIKSARISQHPPMAQDEISPQDLVAHSSSFLQEADVALRKFISLKMQEARSQNISKAQMSALAQHLNSNRKQFLKQLSDPSSLTDIVDQFRQYVE